MTIDDIATASPKALAPILLATIQRLGEHGRDGAVALARILDDGDADFDEGAAWIEDIASGWRPGLNRPSPAHSDRRPEREGGRRWASCPA